MTGTTYRELRNKDNLLQHVYEFANTDNLFELAEVFIDIKKIFKDEDFPIEKYIKSKKRVGRRKVIKSRGYKAR